MAQFYRYPASGSAAANPSVAPDGGPIPGSATVVAGENPSGNVQVLQTDSSGALITTPSPTGTQNENLTEVGGAAISLGQKTEAASLPVVIASDQSTLPISASSLPLPTGASTSANQTTANTALAAIEANQTNGTQVTSVSNFPATQPVSGTVTVVQPTGSNLHVDVDASALPTGASTSALQTQISGQLPATLGQKTEAASLAVTIASDQSSIPVTISGTTPVSGTVTSNQGTAAALAGAWPVEITDGTNVLGTSGNPVRVDPTGTTTQPVSGTVTVTQATGTNLHTVIDSGTVTLSGTSPVSGTVTANQGTANATPWNENIADFGGAAVSLGAKVSASSMPVVLASDQAALPVTGTFFQATQPVSAVSLPLPTGAATSDNQTNGTQKSQIATPTALTVTNAAITVGTTAVRLTVSGSAPASTRVVLVATPDTASTATFYIGTSTVTNSGSTRGVEIKAGQSFIANNDAGDYWIVSSTASQTVTVMEQA